MTAFWTAVTMIFTIAVGAVALYALYRIATAAHRDRTHPQH